jgi:hypothetical protein
MPATHKSLRSGTANKRPTTAIAEGQIALNTNVTSPGLYFKDSTGASIIKIGPVHVGTTAPNVSPAGSSGNSTGEAWLDTSLTPNGWKVWTGAAWTNATPIGSDTVQGLLELATNAETQAGSDTARAVTPAGLQSKVSDSTSTTSSTTIASSTAVKSAYDLANAALPKSGGTVTGNLEIGATGSLSFEGSTADAFETTIAVVDPTADRTITVPNVTGTLVTTGDTGSVTSTMLADGTILDADINAAAAIAGTKVNPDFGSQTIKTTGIVSNALGSAAAPSITFTGDTNTGIYSPGADQIALVKGGTESLRFSDTGALGLSGTNYGTANQVIKSQGSGAAPIWGNAVDYQEFTSSGTWTKPTGVTSIYVEIVGGGGGGGSGGRRATTGARSGGAGGAGGTYLNRWLKASDVAATITVTVGAGGAGGVAQTTDENPGSVGVAGGESSFGALLQSGSAGGGNAGLINGGSPNGGTPSSRSTIIIGVTFYAGTGARGGTSIGTIQTVTMFGGGGGGGGVGAGANLTLSATGGNGGVVTTLASSMTGAAAGAAGTAGESGGGGGGSYVTATTGMPGGAGGFPGGGGGGGSAADNGYNSGAGAAGASGVVRVWSW